MIQLFHPVAFGDVKSLIYPVQVNFVGSLDLPVGLWMLHACEMLFYMQALQHRSEVFIHKLSAIISDKLGGNTKFANQMLKSLSQRI